MFSARCESLTCLGATHITKRWDEDRKPYEATAEDAAYATFMLEGGVVAQINSSWQTRVYRDDLVTFQVDGTHGSAVAGLQSCKIQQRMATPRPVWNPDEKRADDFRAGWQEVPDTEPYPNGFRRQWEMFIRHVVADAPWHHSLLEGAKGVQLAELALGELEARARWVDVPPLSLAGERARAEEGRPCRLTPATLRKPQAVELRLPKPDRGLAAYRMGAPSPFPGQGERPLQPRRLRGRACRLRSACRARSLAHRRDRLGRDDRLSPPSLGARLLGRRGDGHGAARHGPRLAECAGADPPLGRRRQGRRPPHARERRRHRPSRSGGGEERR